MGAKCILGYLNSTKDLGLFFKKNHDPRMISYTDAGYLSDPHNTAWRYGYFMEVF
jgi:uncharacterized membrane-anchored protein